MKPVRCHCVWCGYTSSARSAEAIDAIATDHMLYCGMQRARAEAVREQASAVAGHGVGHTVDDQSSWSRLNREVDVVVHVPEPRAGQRGRILAGSQRALREA
jgi:hypothetical protein